MWFINDFDLISRCDCDCHPQYPNVLAISGFFFIFPAMYLRVIEMYFISYISAMSAMTSVVYHSYHNPIVKTIDVFVAYTLCCVGSILSIQLVFERQSIAALIGLIQVCIIIFINNSPLFRIGEKTRFHWHFTMHVLTVSSLFCLCIALS